MELFNFMAKLDHLFYKSIPVKFKLKFPVQQYTVEGIRGKLNKMKLDSAEYNM